MKIKRYKEFLLLEADETEEEETTEEGTEEEGAPEEEEVEEVYNDEPEEYIIAALTKVKKRIERMFSDEQEIVMPPSQQNINIKDKVVDKESKSFEQMGLRLESSDIHKNSKTHKSLRVKFSDDVHYYDLYIKVDLKEGMSKEDGEDMGSDLVDKCFIKFKKVKIGGWDLEGSITKNDSLKNIDEDYLMDLKVELDDEFGEDEEFKIET